MSVSVVLCVGLLLLFTGVERGNADPALEERDDPQDFTKRAGCRWSTGERVTYNVSINTCNEWSAGTDGEVSIFLIGPDADCWSDRINLDNPHVDDFEIDQRDHFAVTVPKLSRKYELKGVHVCFKQPIGANYDDWCFDYVIVSWNKLISFRSNYNKWMRLNNGCITLDF